MSNGNGSWLPITCFAIGQPGSTIYVDTTNLQKVFDIISQIAMSGIVSGLHSGTVNSAQQELQTMRDGIARLSWQTQDLQARVLALESTLMSPHALTFQLVSLTAKYRGADGLEKLIEAGSTRQPP